MRFTLLWAALMIYCQVSAQTVPDPDNRKAKFPDIPGYQTLLCDFHMHTVFSDGSVWPDIRVQEALRDGLDAIAMTEHLEYQPHQKDIPHPDRNRAYIVAKESATNSELLIIPGSEITRSLPPGHANAIFIEDANKLLIDDPIAVYREANKQGAFVFWNHPNWTAQQPTGLASLTDMHRQLIAEDLLHGIEVVNDVTYSDEALEIALDNDLAIIGTSDIHGLVDWQYEIPQGGHRPITLVFAEDRSLDGIREGLEQRRTIAWFKNILIGRAEYIIPLVEATLIVEGAEYIGESMVARVQINNQSNVRFVLENRSPYNLHSDSDILTIEPGRNIVEVKTVEVLKEFAIKFHVMNTLIAPRTHPEISIKIKPVK